MRIAITGGKGGVGKTFVATSLAVALAKTNRVLLVDADVDCPNAHLVLSVKRFIVKKVFQFIPRFDFDKCIKCGLCGKVCKKNAIVSVQGKSPIFISDLCNGCRVCMIVCKNKAISEGKSMVGKIFLGKKDNITIVSAEILPSYRNSAFVVSEEMEFVKKLKDYEYILIDTSVGIHCDVIEAISGVDLVLAVTEPTPLGKHDLGLVLQLTRLLKLPVKIILNKANLGDKRLIYKIAKYYKVNIIGEIPYKKEFLISYTNGSLISDENIVNIVNLLKK